MHAVRSPETAVPAPRWHFASILLLLLAIAAMTFVRREMNHSGVLEFHTDQRLAIYLRTAGSEWLLLGYVLFGIRRHNRTLRNIVFMTPGPQPKWFSAIAVGLAASVLWMVLSGAIMRVLHPSVEDLRTIQSFLPRTSNQKIGFAILTLTAGFCEEFVYRGYLQQQVQALTRSAAMGIALQAILFALLHLALPWKILASVTAMGLFLGVLAAWRRTLVPGVLMHTLVNLLGGLLSSVATST